MRGSFAALRRLRMTERERPEWPALPKKMPAGFPAGIFDCDEFDD
jgi:hypothetical protein